jgi:hypothetical protein
MDIKTGKQQAVVTSAQRHICSLHIMAVFRYWTLILKLNTFPLCSIWDVHSSNYKDFYLLWYSPVKVKKKYFWATITSIFRLVRVNRAGKVAHNEQAACLDQIPPPHPIPWIWVTTLLTNCICNLNASSPYSHQASGLGWLRFWLVFGACKIKTAIPPILARGFCHFPCEFLVMTLLRRPQLLPSTC